MNSAPPHAETHDIFFSVAISFAISSFFLALLSYNFVDIDLWHEMALIRESMAAGHLLTSDPYAYTPTRPWVDHEWGAGAIAFFTTRWFGGGALILLKFLVAFGTGYCCLRCARKMGAESKVLAWCAPLAAFLGYLGFYTVIRAQAYSFFFTALLFVFLQQDREGKRGWIFVWLVIFPLWLNLHGGFVAGLGLLALHGVEQLLRGRAFRHLALVGLGMCLEVFLNPYGTAYVRYLARAVTMERPYVPEWGPVWQLGPAWTLAFLAAVGIAVYSLIANGWGGVPGILPLGATLVEGLLHRKLLPLFAVAWLSCIPSALQKTAAGGWIIGFAQRRVRFLAAAAVAFTLVCGVASVRQGFWRLAVPQPLYPVGAVNYLGQQRLRGNILVPFRLGSYVSWKLFPAVKVSLDSRYEEVYPERVVDDVFRFYEDRPGWESVLKNYPTDLVLVPRDSPVCEKMQKLSWVRAYSDRQFELYTRPGLNLPSVDDSTSSFIGVFP